MLFLNAELDKLISILEPKYHSIFAYKKMYSSGRYNHRTSNILDGWMNEIPLLPPILQLSGDGFLRISDGMHRTNAAKCLGEIRIPIMVMNHDLVQFGWEELESIGQIEMVLRHP